MSATEMRACLDLLEGFEHEIDALIELVGNQRRLTGTNKLDAQQMLTRLKTRLKDEYHRTSGVKGRASLNSTEAAYYAPAVHQAFCALRMKTNSAPGLSWQYDLNSALMDIRFPASQLRDQLK